MFRGIAECFESILRLSLSVPHDMITKIAFFYLTYENIPVGLKKAENMPVGMGEIICIETLLESMGVLCFRL